MQALPLPPSGLLLAATAVSNQFAQRPALETVVRELLGAAIAEKYPTLGLNLSLAHLAVPQAGAWTFHPLINVVMNYLANGAPLDFDDVAGVAHYLSVAPPGRLRLPGSTEEKLDMKVIETLIEELAQTLPVALQNALSAYWDQDLGNGDNRWRWLGNVLKETLQISGIRQAGLSDTARETVDQLTAMPDREQRVARYGQDAVFAYCLETTLRSNSQTTVLLGPELILTRATNGTTTVLLCHPGGMLEVFASMDAFTKVWGERLDRRYVTEEILIRRYEPDSNIFDYQAAMILNQQLENLGALRLPLQQPVESLQALYLNLTDPGQALLRDEPAQEPSNQRQALTTLRAHLPAWLQKASVEDQAAYRHYSVALASAKQRGAGRTFLSDIQDIRSYTLDALLQALQHDAIRLGGPSSAPPPIRALNPDDLQLTFTIAAGYPGTAGIIRHEQMSLTELAINNLSSRPSGNVHLANRHGLALPSWLTVDYITGSNGLIEQLDIGKRYPQMLGEQLLSNTPQAHQREARFADQQVAQLPLLALEMSLKQEAGMTRVSAQYLAAVMQVAPDQQVFDNQRIVIRHLGLVRAPGATPDIVSNMYLIEAEDTAVGPHILYRPLYPQPLQAFPTRQALLEAIAQPGPLQTSVLTWLSDTARPIYDNGGFLEPHYLRFGQGDEFTFIQPPRPATLSTDGINDELHQCLRTGRLMRYLYSENARVLVLQADRESVSNSESRWQVLFEGGGLLFSSILLPLLRGPAMLTGWLLNLIASLDNDIQGLNDQDPQKRELATVDLLLNLGLLLLEGIPQVKTHPPVLAKGVTERAISTRVPPRVAEQWPAPTAPRIDGGAVGLPGVLPEPQKMVLDLQYAQARRRPSAPQRQRLIGFEAPRPDVIPRPVLNGPRRGLYIINLKWYALMDERWFQVILDAYGGVVVADPRDASQQGPALRSDNNGIWSVDTRLGLYGGAPQKRIQTVREQRAARIRELGAKYDTFLSQQVDQQKRIDINQAVMQRTESDSRFTDVQQSSARQRFDTALQEQTADYQQLLESVRERHELGIPLKPQQVAALLENAVNNARKHLVIAEKDRAALYAANQRFRQDGPSLRQAIIADMQGYEQFIKSSLDINDRSIRWLELRDRHLDELFNLGPVGKEGFTRLSYDRPDEISALAVKDLQIRCLKVVLIRESESTFFETVEEILKPLQPQVRTHSELNALDLTADERVSVLQSLVEHYGGALDALQGIDIVNSDEIEPVYFKRLLSLVDGLYQEVTQLLATEVKPVAQAQKRPTKRNPVVAGKPPKKVIRTRKGSTLIGELKPIGTVDVVEVRSEVGNDLLGMYSKSGDDEWVEYVEQRPPQTELLLVRMQALNIEITPLMVELRESLARMKTAHANLTKQAATLKLVWKLLDSTTGDRKPSLETRHQREMQTYATLHTQYEILLDTLEQRHAQLLPQRHELVQVGQDLEKHGGAGSHVQDRAKTLRTLWEEQLAIHVYQVSWADTLRFTDRGEPMTHLIQRMVQEKRLGDTEAYDEHVTKSIALADLLQRMAIGTRSMETTLELLEQDSVAGRAIREELLAMITSAQRFYPDNLKIHSLIPLSWAAVELSVAERSPLEALYIEHADYSSLTQSLLSHIEVRSSSGYPLDEQRQVYNTILEKYGNYENAIGALKLINPERLHPVSERLLNELGYARALAESELEAVVRRQEELEVEASRLKNLRPKAPTKRIFKTRKRNYFVGDLTPANGQINHEHLSITNPTTGETVASFDQQAGEWVEINEDVITAPPPKSPLRPLATLKAQGQKLLQQRTEIERVITAQQQLLESPASRQTVNPSDWDELLSGQAAKLTELADEIEREHAGLPSAQGLIDDYRAHARDMQRMAQKLCSAAYKRQWPTLEGLDYLWRHQQIDINLTSLADPQRPTLSGDFFTEYAVYDKAQKPPTVLWYAHFHYAAANMPAASYTRAHLKLASQRKYTQKDLLKAHVQAQLHSQQEPGAAPLEKILYVLIAPPQDRLFLAIAPRPQP